MAAWLLAGDARHFFSPNIALIVPNVAWVAFAIFVHFDIKLGSPTYKSGIKGMLLFVTR